MLNICWFPLLKMWESAAVLYTLVWGFPCLSDGPGVWVKSGERAGKWKGFPQLHAYLISYHSQIIFLLLLYVSFFPFRVNCSFYFKIGACRHGDRCSRLHNKPTFSQVRSSFFAVDTNAINIFCMFLKVSCIWTMNSVPFKLCPFLVYLVFDSFLFKSNHLKMKISIFSDNCPSEHLPEPSEQCPVCWWSDL